HRRRCALAGVRARGRAAPSALDADARTGSARGADRRGPHHRARAPQRHRAVSTPVKLLALDTSTSTAGIALVDRPAPPSGGAAGRGSPAVEGDRVLAEVRHDTAGRGADLLVAIDRLCRDAGVAPGELDAI